LCALKQRGREQRGRGREQRGHPHSVISVSESWSSRRKNGCPSVAVRTRPPRRPEMQVPRPACFTLPIFPHDASRNQPLIGKSGCPLCARPKLDQSWTGMNFLAKRKVMSISCGKTPIQLNGGSGRSNTTGWQILWRSFTGRFPNELNNWMLANTNTRKRDTHSCQSPTSDVTHHAGIWAR